MTKIAVDAGHGSQTAGKRTPDGYREHWINVKTAYYLEQALQKNIQGFISKDASLDEVEKAIISVASGSIFYNKTTRDILVSMFRTGKEDSNYKDSVYTEAFYNYRTLTQREKNLFELLAQQKEIPEIAEILGKAEKTINNQTSIIYQKLNIHNRLELLKIAKTLGVII